MIKHLFKPKKFTRSQIMSNKRLTYDYGIENPVKELNEVINMKIKAEESIKLDDGQHDGKIESIEYREEEYDYTDIGIIVQIKGKDRLLQCSYPTSITENTALGMLIQRFGAKIEVGKEYEVEEFITKGMLVSFQTITKKTPKGEFSNILRESLKPKK